jgi:hypothetical protein
MTTHKGLLVAAATLTTLLVTVVAAPASADPPPEAAGTTTHGFVFERGVVTTIDHPDAKRIPATPDAVTGTEIGGINDRGDMLGAYERPDGVVPHFVLDRKGRFVELEAPPGRGGPGLTYETLDINNRGEIVGYYNDDQGFTTTGFLRTRTGRYVDIEVPGAQLTGPVKLNDRGQVVGLYVDDAGVHGFLWEDGDHTTIDVRGAAATIPFGINNRRQIVGNYVDDKGIYHAFLRDRRGAVTKLPDAPGVDPAEGDATLPTSINDRGQIVGEMYDAQGGDRAYRFERGRYTFIDGSPDAVYTRALDINNRGQVVGGYGTKPPTSQVRAPGGVDLPTGRMSAPSLARFPAVRGVG